MRVPFRGGQLRVPEHLLDDERGCTLNVQQSAAGVWCIMKPPVRNLYDFAEGVELASGFKTSIGVPHFGHWKSSSGFIACRLA
jgi:hypothetical protein